MKKKIKNVFEGAEPIVLLLYICSVSAALMYTLCRSHVFITTVLMTVVCGLIFSMFYTLRNKRGFSFLGFIIMLVSVNVMCSIVGSPYRSPSFVEFIFRSSDFFQWDYALLSIALFSFIIGFTVAYFSVYLPRANFLLLPAFIPLILAARTLGGLPVGYIIFLAVGYLAAILGLSRPEQPDRHKYFNDPKSRKERLGAAGILVAVAAVLLIILPRAEEAPFVEYVDSVFVARRNNYYGRPELSDFMQSSIPNRGANRPAENVLFSVVTDSPQNIMRWSFDSYEGEDGWTYDDDFNTGTRFWQDERPLADWMGIARRLKEGAKNGKLKKYRDELLALDIPETYVGNMTIQVRDGSETAVVMHPLGTYNLLFPDDENLISYRNPKDEIFTKNDMKPNPIYKLQYYVNIEEPSESVMRFFEKNYTPLILSAALEEGVIDEKTYDVCIEERDGAVDYFQKTFDVSPEIEALADEITAGLESDYDKARAIEKWFKDAGFVYDMDFVPEEISAEYFLFESKRGICTDFATATTLLLRAARIPARYTEGFVLSEDILDTYGKFNVTPAQAHAYSTAYIEGVGWIEIDGTKYANSAGYGEMIRMVMLIVVAAAAVLLIVGLVFRRQLSELLFAVRFKLIKKKNVRIREVYLRTRRMACRMAEIPQSSATAEEVREILSNRLGLEQETAEITETANLMFYSKSGDLNGIDERHLYDNYKNLLKMKKEKGIK